MANTSVSGPVRSANGFAAYSDSSSTSAVSIALATQGTGVVIPTVGPIVNFTTVTTDATAGDVTYTAAQIKGGLILRDPGANRADLFPTAAALVAAMPSCVVGTSLVVHIRNEANGAETITMTTNTGLTLSGTMTIAQNNAKSFLIVLTNVTSGAEAATVYSLGTVVF